MRKVKVFKWSEFKEGNQGRDKIPDGEGFFNAWGVDWEVLRDGVGHFSCAIIERTDGTVETPPACLIQFMDKSSPELTTNEPIIRHQHTSK